MRVRMLACALLAVATPAAAATSITTAQGQTISWSGERTVGQYANGDWWILVESGSLSVTKSNPTPSGGLHGCEINMPGVPASWAGNLSFTQWGNSANQRPQGIDSRDNVYAAAQNACQSATFSVATDKTLMTGISRPACVIDGGGSSEVAACIDVIEAVTFVSVQPAAGDFRPGFASLSKTTPGNKSEIDYEKMLKFDPATITGEPTLAQVLPMFRFPQWITSPNQQRWQNTIPLKNWGKGDNTNVGAYGRNIGALAADILMFLSLDVPDADKEVPAIHVVQVAIDVLAIWQTHGMRQSDLMGHIWPSKEMILFAAAIMDRDEWVKQIRPSVVGKRVWATDQTYFLVTPADVATPRLANCAHNNHNDNNASCAPYTEAMIGKGAWCDNWYSLSSSGADCSSKQGTSYNWIVAHYVPIYFILRQMSLEDESENAGAFGYVLGTNSIAAGWYYPTAVTSCTVSAGGTGTNNAKIYTCSLLANHWNDTPIDSSPTPADGGPNEVPTISLTTPSTNPTHVTTATTITLGGTAADSDGTVALVAAVADCDGSVANGGTAAAWSFVVDLPADTVCTITITATDDDAAVSEPVAVTVLRTTDTPTLLDTFPLAGVWPTPNPYRYGQVVGSSLWAGGVIAAPGTGRNLFYRLEPAPQNVLVAVTVASPPAAQHWPYVMGRGTVGGGTYSFVRATAEVDRLTIAQYTNGVQGPIENVFVSPPPALGNVLGIRFEGTQACLRLDGQAVSDGQGNDGCVVTDLTGSLVGAGGWGGGAAVDNLSVTSLEDAPDDETAPGVVWVDPATDPQPASATPYTTAALTAADEMGGSGLDSCDWLITQNPSESGSCGGTLASPTIASIDLIEGLNTLQVTVCDAASNCTVVTRGIVYTPDTADYEIVFNDNGGGGQVGLTGTDIAILHGTTTGCDELAIDGGMGDPLTRAQPRDDSPETYKIRLRVAPGVNVISYSCFASDALVYQRERVVTASQRPKRF